MKITAEPRSDQWNAEDFIGGPRTFTVAGVRGGTAEQKYDILLEGEERVWRPPLTVLRLLMAGWGDDADVWIGRRVTLYNDPAIRFGKDLTGGIRISHMSNLPDGKPLKKSLQESRGKRKTHVIDPLPDTPAPPAPSPVAVLLGEIKTAADAAGVDVATIATEWAESHDGQHIKDATDLGALELIRDDLRGRTA